MSYIKIEHLKYKYPATSVLALNDICLEIEKGNFIGIVGENGAGKSTLCYALSGLVPTFYKGAYGGKVLIEDKEVAKSQIADICQKVGLVFQNPFNQLSGAKDTVFEEVAYGLQNLGIERNEIIDRVNHMLDFLDISEYKNQNPFDLSGGQMQRVSLASILVMKPDIIILDEPTSQLDPAGSEEIFKAIDKIKNLGITVIIVEQKMEKLADYCDKIILMHDGKVIDYDTPEKIFSRDDLSSLGVEAPIYTRICKYYDLKKKNDFYPSTWRDMIDFKDFFQSKNVFNQKASETAIANSNSNPVFEIENLSFHYNSDKKIIENLSFCIYQGATAIIGENGAGKTTIVKLLKGLLKPVFGCIYYQRENINNKTVAMLSSDIGYVFQNPDDQIFKYNVLDEVMFGPLNIGVSKEKAKNDAENALKTVGLLHKKEKNPYDLELSERKLIAIASVIAMNTNVLILDEPTIAQDKNGKDIIGKIIKDLKSHGKTVISVLHDMDFVASYFDYIIVMKKGQILTSGTREEVFVQPQILKEACIEQPHLTRLCSQLGLKGIFFDMEDLPK